MRGSSLFLIVTAIVLPVQARAQVIAPSSPVVPPLDTPVAATASLSQPQPLAEPVRAMLERAMADGDEDTVATIAKFARQSLPADGTAIDTLVGPWLAARANERQTKAEQEKLAQATAAEQKAQAERQRLAVERARQANLLKNWKGQSELGAYLTTGNTESNGVTVGLKFDRDGGKWAQHVFARADFQSLNGVRSREYYLTGGKVDFKFSPRGYSFLLGQYERDRFMGFTTRLSSAAGLGYRIIDEAPVTLNLEAGPAYRSTHYTDGRHENLPAGRGALAFGWQATPTIKLTQDGSAYLDPQTGTVSSLTALDLKLSQALKARLSYSLQYESNPLSGRKPFDTASRISLIYGI